VNDPASLRRKAAVAVAVNARPPHGVIFVERASHLRDHPGQIGLPGGRVDAADGDDLRRTVLRELHEEIGVTPERVTIVGNLAQVSQRVNTFDVTPFVAVIAPGPFTIDGSETAGMFTMTRCARERSTSPSASSTRTCSITTDAASGGLPAGSCARLPTRGTIRSAVCEQRSRPNSSRERGECTLAPMRGGAEEGGMVRGGTTQAMTAPFDGAQGQGRAVILNSIEVMFGGQAGDGSLTTGDLIAGVFKRMGLEVYTYKDFPSRIRGGHTNYVIRAGERRDYGMADAVDGLVAFDLEAVEAHIDEMRPGGFVIFDNTSEVPDGPLRRDVILVRDSRSPKSPKRTGARARSATRSRWACSARWSGWIPRSCAHDVTGVYARKGEKVVDINLRAIEAGESTSPSISARCRAATGSRRVPTATGSS
jgi:Pyruvate/2-oxoacid:ferredoxin oxidoreductase gamma subunit/ADP-ribose pyrophosphatase YjhB (NUDIX family)